MRRWREIREIGGGAILRASVTPLASIFGSGFLIIVPVLERSLGVLAIWGALAVTAVAWLVGSAIRHNIATVEPAAAESRLHPVDVRLERLSDIAIALAYIVSVALYLRIMAEYVVDYAGLATDGAASSVGASLAVATIVLVGLARGFAGLDLMERLALGAVLGITTALGIAFVLEDAGRLAGDGLDLPPIPDTSAWEAALMLGGIVITVQGFETVRYLAEEYDAPTRIWASRAAQAIAASIYIAFVGLATPLMGLGTSEGADASLLEIVERTAPLLALPLVVCAVLSQFSAATADTVAAHGNLVGQLPRLFGGGRSYVFSGVAAVAMIVTIPTLTIVTIASRAFAAYYFLQCVVAARTARSGAARIGFAALAALMAGVTLLAQPVG
jgi:hypothetical protein